jgi:uncharacterized protein (TIGR03084 family)
MLPQALDFREESDALYALLEPLERRDWVRKTQFKDWTISDILSHLHFGNYLAYLSLTDGEAFLDLIRRSAAAAKTGTGHLAFGYQWLGGVRERALLERWREFYFETAESFSEAEPTKRVRWVGPDMSVRSSISARLMETWAHGQAIYDLLGQVRRDTDRIENIVVLGINTFGWTFANRKLEVPAARPSVRLTAPSGASWEWLGPDSSNLIEG